MRSGRPKMPIILSKEEHVQLKSMVISRSPPHGPVTRAHIVLMSAEGATNHDYCSKSKTQSSSRL